MYSVPNDCDRFIAEMEYGDSTQDVLALGIYHRFQYVIKNIKGSHPCGYVNVSACECDLDLPQDCEYDTEKWEWVDCHGGITYSDHGLHPFAGGYWIGWDYAHLYDWCGLCCIGGLKYTTEDVILECYSVIRQIEARIKRVHGECE